MIDFRDSTLYDALLSRFQYIFVHVFASGKCTKSTIYPVFLCTFASVFASSICTNCTTVVTQPLCLSLYLCRFYLMGFYICKFVLATDIFPNYTLYTQRILPISWKFSLYSAHIFFNLNKINFQGYLFL